VQQEQQRKPAPDACAPTAAEPHRYGPRAGAALFSCPRVLVVFMSRRIRARLVRRASGIAARAARGRHMLAEIATLPRGRGAGPGKLCRRHLPP
jgi:hypothetical protein